MQLSRISTLLFVIVMGAGAVIAAIAGSPLPLLIAAPLATYLLFAIKVADQWEKVAVLRMGRYAGLRGPGIFHIIPIIDTLSSTGAKATTAKRFSTFSTAPISATSDTQPM